MLQNYLKITVRNLLKHKTHTFINVVGLAIGLACCILIVMFVQDELNYDRHHKHANRIYRVAGEAMFGGNHFNSVVAPAPLAQTLATDFPEVIAATHFRDRGSFLVKRDVQNYKEERAVFADNAVFEVFTIPLLAGDPATALSAPNAVAISAASAAKFFPESASLEDVIGKNLTFDNQAEYQITAVYEDMPANSHFHFDFLLAMEGLPESKNGMWLSNNFQTYLLLEEGASAIALEEKFPAMIEKYLGPQVQQMMGASLEDFEKAGNSLRYYLQPLIDIHLHSDLSQEFEPNGNITFVYIFSAIALFILLIACINFMNLSTARSAHRAKEVGIRKALGSFKSQLIGQFLTESVMLSFIALLLAMGMVELMLPWFNGLSGKALASNYFGSAQFTLGLLGTAVVVGLLAGSYPALFLSAFKPIRVLKEGSGVSKNNRSPILRKALVVFQFTATIALITGTIVINNQLGFIQSKKLGFNKEQVLVLHDVYALGNQVETFKNEMLQHPDVIHGTTTGYLPVSSNRSDTGFWPEGMSMQENPVSMQIWSVDDGYVPTMDMEILKGRNFSKEFGSDSTGIVLNERAVGLFGFDDPIGKRVNTVGWTPGKGLDPENILTYTVIGVVKNFHFESLKENITALGMRLGNSNSMMSLRFEVADVSGLLSFAKDKWNEFAPGQPFEYTFLDDRFSNMYTAEQRLGEIFSVFATLSILVACLGLFGLASFTAEQRTKEIGVRKVLGASIGSIIVLLSKEFTKWVLIANVIAWPVAYFAMNEWLQGFAFRIDLGWWIFAISGALALGIAILTVAYQAIKAAMANPIDALRYE